MRRLNRFRCSAHGREKCQIFWPGLAAALLLLNGCHLAAIGGTSGALIGGAVANRPGAMIGGGAGLLAGAVADVVLYPMHRETSRSECDSYKSPEEQRACEKGHVQAEKENRSDRVYRAERHGYEVQKGRYY